MLADSNGQTNLMTTLTVNRTMALAQFSNLDGYRALPDAIANIFG